MNLGTNYSQQGEYLILPTYGVRCPAINYQKACCDPVVSNFIKWMCFGTMEDEFLASCTMRTNDKKPKIPQQTMAAINGWNLANFYIFIEASIKKQAGVSGLN